MISVPFINWKKKSDGAIISINHNLFTNLEINVQLDMSTGSTIWWFNNHEELSSSVRGKVLAFLYLIFSNRPSFRRTIWMLMLPFYPGNVNWRFVLLIKSSFPSLSCHAIVFMEHLYKTVITGNWPAYVE